MDNKKPGKRYTKKELQARGWTPEMIRSHLKTYQQNKKNYYRAAEVSSCEADPAIAQQLSDNRKRSEERKYLRKIDNDERRKAAAKAKAAFDN